MKPFLRIGASLLWLLAFRPAVTLGDNLRVGAAAAELEADDSMVIAGGITEGKAAGQEGKLRCVAVVLAQQEAELALVACDVLMLTRKTLDPVVAESSGRPGFRPRTCSLIAPIPTTPRAPCGCMAYIAELANDWIGYLPDRDGHQLGGYQVWTGFHSYAEPGTGERIADAAVELLQELAKDSP